MSSRYRHRCSRSASVRFRLAPLQCTVGTWTALALLSATLLRSTSVAAWHVDTAPMYGYAMYRSERWSSTNSYMVDSTAAALVAVIWISEKSPLVLPCASVTAVLRTSLAAPLFGCPGDTPAATSQSAAEVDESSGLPAEQSTLAFGGSIFATFVLVKPMSAHKRAFYPGEKARGPAQIGPKQKNKKKRRGGWIGAGVEARNGQVPERENSNIERVSECITGYRTHIPFSISYWSDLSEEIFPSNSMHPPC
ncbi:hypothetical protein QBC40DRAFT_326042 [Triangularia verruculosa]|uniref:Uncharacterized protein n=1 Tax=Triangularia verruculosa TaxID=2587418 RepID=A0AAN6XIH3_9PEZI|nr:hypothetical protein QBC40DRAFT_326042 [Triangularia verruculosa]